MQNKFLSQNFMLKLVKPEDDRFNYRLSVSVSFLVFCKMHNCDHQNTQISRTLYIIYNIIYIY